MRNELDLYNSGLPLEEIGINLFNESISSSNAFAKAVGDFTSALGKPILDYKRLDAMETTIIIVSKRHADVKKTAIQSLENVLMNERLCPEAQVRAVDAIYKLANG